ncbi:MAG: glycosyltransferase family 39 protein [Thermoproteota archaeon]
MSLTESIQKRLQISTGIPPLSPDPISAYFELAWATILEEIAFRALLLGVFYSFYLNRGIGNLSIRKKLSISLLSFLSPESAKRLLRSWGSPVSFKIEKDEWVIIVFSSALFAFSHYAVPGAWGIGKLTLAFIQGFAMALSYALYGIYASLLVHWYFNYYLYTNRLVAVLRPNLSFLSLFSEAAAMVLTALTLTLLVLLNMRSMIKTISTTCKKYRQHFMMLLSRACVTLKKGMLTSNAVKKAAPELALLAIVVLTLILRLSILEYPKRETSGGAVSWDLIFDERYYVSAARDMLEGKATNNEHPPLVKAFIALGIVFLGDNPAGWRAFTISAGTASIFLIYVLSLLLNSSREVSLCLVTLFAFDIMVFNIGQIAILDAPAMTFMLAASVLILRKRYDLGGFFLGLASLCKLTSVFSYLGIAAFLVLSEERKSFRKTMESCLRIGVAALVVFLAGLWVYDSWYSAFAKNPLGHISYMLTYHSSLKYQDPKEVVLPLQWINPLDPFAPMPFYVMTTREVAGGIIKDYHPVAYYGIYSPLWWSVWLVMPLSLFYILREAGKRSFDRTRLFSLAWILSSFLPYVLLAYLMYRWVYPFYFYSTLPGLYVNLAGYLNKCKYSKLLIVTTVFLQVFWFIVWFPVKPKAIIDIFTSLGLPV